MRIFWKILLKMTKNYHEMTKNCHKMTKNYHKMTKNSHENGKYSQITVKNNTNFFFKYQTI